MPEAGLNEVLMKEDISPKPSVEKPQRPRVNMQHASALAGGKSKDNQ